MDLKIASARRREDESIHQKMPHCPQTIQYLVEFGIIQIFSIPRGMWFPTIRSGDVMMKKVVILGERKAGLVEVPDPQPKEDWVVVKVHAAPI